MLNPTLTHRGSLQKMDDEDLMSQFQAGTLQAFDILVKRYSERLENYLYRFVHDSMQCEDLVQETFLRVHRNRHSYKQIAKFSTWLYTIAGNLARSEYRKRKRRRMYSLQAVNRNDETYEQEIPDDANSPEEVTEMRMQLGFVQEALDELSEGFREVVMLRDVQQLSYDEIAAITGLPMGTVKSRINRGRTQLQKLLKDVYPYQRDSSRRMAATSSV